MEIIAPKTCPSCGSDLVEIGQDLFCNNLDCDAKISKQLQKFAKVLGIKGLGEASIEKLPITTFSELYNISKEEMEQYLGNKIGAKIYEEVQKSLETTFATVLEACSIKLIGNTLSKKIASVVSNFNDLESKLDSLPLGEKAREHLVGFIMSPKFDDIKTIPFKYTTQERVEIKPKNLTVVVTGSVKGYTRTTIKEALESMGLKVTTSVSKNTNFVLCDDGSENSKTEKATELNIPVVTFNKLIEVINNV